METGIELIAKERQEQIEKHGFTLENDKGYENKELLQAARFCLSWANSEVKIFAKGEDSYWPKHWSLHFMNKILNKTKKDQLIVAGAFLKAENDRRGDSFWNDFIQKIAAEIDRIIAIENTPAIVALVRKSK